MKLQDIAVVDFHFFEDLRTPKVQAMVTFRFQETPDPQVAWVDLTSEEAAMLIGAARIVEERLLTGTDSLPEPVKRRMGFDTGQG